MVSCLFMAGMRHRAVTLQWLNIVTHPHEDGEEGYRTLLRKAYKSKSTAKVRGERSGVIMELRENKTGPNQGVMTGRFATFLNVDMDHEWLSLARMDSADEEELGQIALPEHLKPNLRYVDFVFSPRRHLMGISKEMKANTARPFLRELLAPQLPNRHTLEVHVVQEDRALESILASTIRKITIVVRRPNPGDLDANFERQILKRLEEMGAEEARVDWKAQQDAQLKLDETAKEMAQAALSNGHVRAEVVEKDGRTKTVDTTDIPLTTKFEELATTFTEAVWSAGRKWLADRIDRRK